MVIKSLYLHFFLKQSSGNLNLSLLLLILRAYLICRKSEDGSRKFS